MLKFLFPLKIFFRKIRKIFNRTVFFFSTSKKVGKNLITSSGGGYFVTWRKIFLMGYLKELFKKLWTKILAIFKFFNLFLTYKFVIFHEPPTPLLPLILSPKYYIVFATFRSEPDISTIFLFLNQKIFKIVLKFFENKIAPLVVWRGCYQDETLCI